MNYKAEVQQRISTCREQQLPTLDLSNCALTHVPTEVFTLVHLQVLDVSHNKLSSLPRTLANLKNLGELYLNHNQLNILPVVITHLCNLKRLFLDNNNLYTLPESFSRLQSLRDLFFRDNQLSEFPEVILHLSNLRQLYLERNQLYTIPEAIISLSSLYHLSLNDNPLTNVPPEIVVRGVGAIRKYLIELSSDESDYIYEAKLLLVGEGYVGKTSLAGVLTIPNYKLGNEKSTQGIDIRSLTIPQRESGLKKDFRLNIWDFGGQEIYHSTHQFFLTKRSLYLLVTESRKEDKHEDFYYWLNIINLLGDKSPVIIVLNKIDQPTKELPIREYQQIFPNIMQVERVSCNHDYQGTIIALKDSIRRILTDKTLMPHIGSELSKIWVIIRKEIEHIRASGRNYISCDEYLALCRQHGLKEDSLKEERAFFLSEFFHDIGVFLHFRDDITLHDTIFLNYEWITDGVYKVLNNEKIKKQYGHFNDQDLMDIWSDEKYKGKRTELLTLMRSRKFELCYTLPDYTYLIPQLLPVDEQPYEWRGYQNNLHFEYRYKFMPRGILSRFIVKRHQDIYQKTHWRYGVLLEYQNTRALIRERYFDRKLTIVLEGENKKGFLDIIRKTIEEIHTTFNTLAVEEMITCNCVKCKEMQQPYLHEYDLLKRCLQNGINEILCQKSLVHVNIDNLINAIFLQANEPVSPYDLTINIMGDVIGDMTVAKVDGSKNTSIGKNLNQTIDESLYP